MTDLEARAHVAVIVHREAMALAENFSDTDEAKRLATGVVRLANRIIDHYLAALFDDIGPTEKGRPS